MLTKAELQRLRSLRDKKNREALGLFVIEGEKVVGELIAAQFPFVKIYATSEWPGISGNRLPPGPAAPPPRTTEISLTRTGGVKRESSGPGSDPSVAEVRLPDADFRVIRVTADEMMRASHFPTPSNVLAIGKISRPNLTPGALEHGLTLALDGVQDAGNVGTLLRVADWFAFDRVILSPDCADLFHQKVINASMGSFARMPAHSLDLVQTLAGLAARSPLTPIIGCDLKGDDVHALPPLHDAVVVIGSEGRGLSPAVAALVTRCVTIPRYGDAESLNAAVAAAIVCDNLRRAR